MCALAHSMDSLLFTVIVIICISKDAAKPSDCDPGKDMACSTNTLRVDNAQICYTKSKNGWKAKLTCDKGRLTGPDTYTCQDSRLWTPPFSSSCVSTDAQQTTFVSTVKYTTETEGNSNNTTPFTEKAPASSEDSGSVVVVAVLVSVVVVIALAAVIVFILWRRRRPNQQQTTGGYSGTMISNKGYEDDNGLERHISLQDMHPNNSVDSEYAEISPENLNVEETARSMYQTIESLPEDRLECNGGYGQLNIQTTQFIDNSYSHIAVDTTSGDTFIDATYAHTGKASNAEELDDDAENATTYNHLETVTRISKGNLKLFKNEKIEASDDIEVVYNHTTDGHLTLVHENEGDSYSHLNLTGKTRGNKQNDLEFLTHSSKTQTYDTALYGPKTQKIDSDNDDSRNSIKQADRGGYELSTGTANIYFTLEPESKNEDTDVSVKVTTEMFEKFEEGPDHDYFILEKTDLNT